MLFGERSDLVEWVALVLMSDRARTKEGRWHSLNRTISLSPAIKARLTAFDGTRESVHDTGLARNLHQDREAVESFQAKGNSD